MDNQATFRQIVFASCLFLGAFCLTSTVVADDDETPSRPNEQSEDKQPRRQASMKTFGGRQFWGDVHFFHGWRIQKNTLTGHFRLLDPNDYRHASGSRKECDDELARIAKARNLEPMTGKVVMLVHGIIRSSKSFKALAARLQKIFALFGFKNLKLHAGDFLRYGWPDDGPYDAIIATAAYASMPERVLGQLARGGVFIAPIGRDTQELMIIRRNKDGPYTEHTWMQVRFSMMPGEDQGGVF